MISRLLRPRSFVCYQLRDNGTLAHSLLYIHRLTNELIRSKTRERISRTVKKERRQAGPGEGRRSGHVLAHTRSRRAAALGRGTSQRRPRSLTLRAACVARAPPAHTASSRKAIGQLAEKQETIATKEENQRRRTEVEEGIREAEGGGRLRTVCYASLSNEVAAAAACPSSGRRRGGPVRSLPQCMPATRAESTDRPLSLVAVPSSRFRASRATPRDRRHPLLCRRRTRLCAALLPVKNLVRFGVGRVCLQDDLPG
ncbi:hypothetical protein HPB50_021863 [Hyalomma asiaticum]|uniref:Uncharacterized protein n=1 Tax=Hyalomma asiaticum TaxID=266040 RepID=A0ACB7SYM4_HYAAI|nr:hypothetical protein HPB50_021863 [Hyalomma asiaticum]